MNGIVSLDDLLQSLDPELGEEQFVFCTASGSIGDYADLNPVAVLKEEEGLTLILPLAVAESEALAFEGPFRKITLKVHSSLDAVGLTAAVSTQLAAQGIPANVVAGYYHDHLFVPSASAEQALSLLHELSRSCS